MLARSRLVCFIATADAERARAFYHGTLLDHLVTHPIHETTMAAIDAKFSPALDANYHRITDQAMYDLAQALGATTVKLAAFH